MVCVCCGGVEISAAFSFTEAYRWAGLYVGSVRDTRQRKGCDLHLGRRPFACQCVFLAEGVWAGLVAHTGIISSVCYPIFPGCERVMLISAQQPTPGSE